MKAVFSVVSIIGVLIIIDSILIMLRPDMYRKAMSFFISGKMIYLAGMIKSTLGVVFLIFARGCIHPWVVIAFGLLSLTGGISCFAIDIEKLKRFVAWWQGRSDLWLRFIGIVALIIGVVLTWAGVPELP